jgi:dipeptidyl aminopeptidase/acylaminoacyl peptidase
VSAGIEPYLRIRSAHSPRWLDGGARIAFIGDQTGTPQAYAMSADGGWPDLLTHTSERAASILTDGATLVFTRDVGGNERGRLWAASPERPLADADTIHSLGAFSPAGGTLAFTHTTRNDVDFDLAIVDVATGDRREVAELAGWNVVLDWGPRGILVARAHSNVDHDLLLVDPASGAQTVLTAHEGAEQWLPACFAEDGAVLAASDRGAEHARLVRLAADGSVTVLTPDDADVEAIAVAPGRLAYLRNVAGASELTVDGAVVTLPEGVAGSLAFSPDGTRLAFDLTMPDAPFDVYVLDAQGARPVSRADLGGVARADLLRPSWRSVRSFDGLEVPYLLYGPTDVPSLCWVHGGPESQSRPALNAVIQFLAARGIAVAVPNVRGSTGYGKTYAALDDVALRPHSVADLAALGRALGAERGVPVGVMGGSYGGYMTLAAITEHPSLWSAAVDIVGIANLVTFLERTGAYRRALREAEYGSLEHHRDLLVALSPIHKVDRITTPLLVIHGANDPRVPISEAEQVVEAIRGRGGDVTYLRYEDEGHGLVRLANRIDAYPQVAAFLERHLLGR